MTQVTGYIVYLPCGPKARPPAPSEQEPPPAGGFPRLIELVTEGFNGQVESGATYSAGSGGNTMTNAQLHSGSFGGGLTIAETLPSLLGGTYKFAFWNVSGGYNASDDYPVGQTSFDRLVPPAAVTVGDEPITVLLVYATLYGTTVYVGGFSSDGHGTVFSISTTGAETVLHPFYGYDGYYPAASLINVNGTLYGTTEGGGAYGSGAGTAFSITTGGSLTTLHSFGSASDAAYPAAPLLNVRGALYGTTAGGGTYGKGTVFRMSLNGTDEKVIHDFGHGSDGETPLAGLIDVKGTLYGTTSAGGKYGDGTVFTLTP